MPAPAGISFVPVIPSGYAGLSRNKHLSGCGHFSWGQPAPQALPYSFVAIPRSFLFIA